jgi:hypothetical protein
MNTQVGCPTAPLHDKDMARDFLAALDPIAIRFTFQFFGDGADKHAEILHGTLDEVWAKVRALNTPQRQQGVFVTVNETDFKGRRNENILRARALFADADGDEQVERSMAGINTCAAPPSMVVTTGRGLHFYYLCDDIPLDQFCTLQETLIEKLGTDGAVKDLPRVLRLPGTLHLKNPHQPKLVRLHRGHVRRWTLSELMAKLGSLPSHSSASLSPPRNNVVHFPDWVINSRPSAFANLPVESLSAGLRATMDEICSAVSAIPAAAISGEQEWMRLARGLAHEAAHRADEAEQLWATLDMASRGAPSYDEADNRSRWERYKQEALTRADPITVLTVFHLARQHGWKGWSPPIDPSALWSDPAGVTLTGTTALGGTAAAGLGPVNSLRAVSIATLPLIPPKRQWLHGTDLVRGAVSMIVAPGGRAKSTWLIACALACASGRPLLDAHVFGGPLGVLYVSTEDASSEIALRIRAAMKHYGLTDAHVPGLNVIGADRWGLHLLRAVGSVSSLDERGWTALAAELDQAKPDVLIIDPLINAMGGVSTNDNSAAALLIGQLAGLAAARKISVILAHHASKNRDPTSAESAMGAATFINLARIALGIEPLAEKDAGRLGLPPWEAKSIFRVVGTKQNFSPPDASDRWYRLMTVEIANQQPPIYPSGDRVAVIEPFHPGTSTPRFPPAMIRDALLAIDRADPPLSPSRSSRDRYAAPVIAAAIAPHRGGRQDEIEGKAVFDHLTETALIEVAEIKVSRPGSRSDNRKGLVLTPGGKLAMAAPHFPQSPAGTLQGDAGGEPSGSPATPGGCGGIAGADSIAAANRPTDAERLASQPPSGQDTALLFANPDAKRL